MTRAAFENAMVIVMALGGSTNAVLHLLAMARACHVPLSLDDFQVSRLRAPVSDYILIFMCQSSILKTDLCVPKQSSKD